VIRLKKTFIPVKIGAAGKGGPDFFDAKPWSPAAGAGFGAELQGFARGFGSPAFGSFS
jgi:hypothetical protein